jgi:hypothetical protein
LLRLKADLIYPRRQLVPHCLASRVHRRPSVYITHF